MSDEPVIIGAEFNGGLEGELAIHLYHESTPGSEVPVLETRSYAMSVRGMGRVVNAANDFDRLHAADIRRAREIDYRRRKWCKPEVTSSAGCLLGTPGCEIEHANLESPIAWALKDMGTGKLSDVVEQARRRWGWRGGPHRPAHGTETAQARDRIDIGMAHDEVRRLQREGYAKQVTEADDGMAGRGREVWRWTGD